MASKSCILRTGWSFSALPAWGLLTLLLALTAWPTSSTAQGLFDFRIAGKPLTVMGYINQGFQFGIAGSHYDTRSGFQAAIFQLLVETAYSPVPNVKIFASTNFNANWAYPILSHDDAWREKEFDKSRDNYYILDDYETLLKEAHVTWTPPDFVFRLGKQIVAWGETDGVRVMDQINPTDTRRGISDVEFETTIVPIWLLKAEYYPGLSATWLQDLNLEFVYNMNADFIANKGFSTGNDAHGIWSPDVFLANYYELPFLAGTAFNYIPQDIKLILPPTLGDFFDRTFPIIPARLGKLTEILDRPDQWDPDYMEYALRLKIMLFDTIVTLNGFYGREKSPVTISLAELPSVRLASDGWLIAEPRVVGYFPLLRFVGLTLARDIPFLRTSYLGSVAPVIRVEALYAFDSTFATNGKATITDLLVGQGESFEQFDFIHYSIGIDWKIRVSWLNAKDGIMISPQFVHKHVLDYPENYGLLAAGGVPTAVNNYNVSLMLRTTYFHNKIIPLVYWMYSVTGPQVGKRSVEGNMVMFQLTYEQSHRWNYTIQSVFLMGTALQPLSHKDNVTLTIAYKF